jgi:hypothetical protein
LQQRIANAGSAAHFPGRYPGLSGKASIGGEPPGEQFICGLEVWNNVMPNSEQSVPTILFVGASHSLLTGSAADRLSQLYRVRVAETPDTAVRYLRCMRFDLVVIKPNVSYSIVSAISKVVSPDTATYFPGRAQTPMIVSEIKRRLDLRRVSQ